MLNSFLNKEYIKKSSKKYQKQTEIVTPQKNINQSLKQLKN